MTSNLGIGLDFGLEVGVVGSRAALLAPPFAVSDFKNNAYSINGVSKAYSDLWKALPASMNLTAEGLVYEGPTGAGSGSATLSVADSFQALLDPAAAVGVSAVFDVTPSKNANTNNLEIWVGYIGVHQAAVVTTLGVNNIRYSDTNNDQIALASIASGDKHKVAGTIAPTLAAVSVDGNDTVTETPYSDWALLNPHFQIYGYCHNTAGSALPRFVIEQIAFYHPLVTDLASLKTLSSV